MKIFVIRNPWRDSDFGGAELFALNLVKELNSQKQDAYLVTGSENLISKSSVLSRKIIRGPFSNHQILSKHRFVFFPLYLMDLYKGYRKYLVIFTQNTPNLVHATGQQECISATFAAKKLNIPIVWSDHGELKNSTKLSFMPPFGLPGLLLKRASRYVKSICMVNPNDIQLVKESFKSNINIIPNGVPEMEKAKKKLNYEFVFASRIIREKGIFELLEAFTSLRDEYPKIKLLIAGDGPSFRYVKEYVALNDGITLKRYDDSYIAGAKCFVLPTYTEAQSLALIKAMMYEVPIITTDIEGNRHFLKKNYTALFVKPRDRASLIEGMRYALTHREELEKIARRAKRSYQKDYKLSTVVKKYYIPMYKKYVAN